MSIAYERNTDLAFDTQILRKCAGEYSDAAADLRDLVKNLDECLKDLKDSGWTTPAGTAFHDMVNTKWSDNIEKYAQLLDTLESILLEASEQYESLVIDNIRQTKVGYGSRGRGRGGGGGGGHRR